MVNDLVPDCPGIEADDELLLRSYWLNNNTVHNLIDVKTCPQMSTSCISGFLLKCYPRNRICVLEIDHDTNQLKYCRDGSHLSNCSTHVCPSMYKCSLSYCIPFHYVCNGRIDCPHGEDELNCNTSSCPGLLKCRYDGLCVHLNAVGNDEVDCPISRDDEALLQVVKCPTGCLCLGYAVTCSNRKYTEMPSFSEEIRKIVLCRNRGWWFDPRPRQTKDVKI